ncbi:diguanylate cyclase [Thermus thermophilus SG0.5JP17-16]|uniref:Diguanylate cyclase n=1 Tax=Thermus thermophilus (strain SG0.5JP17-16) TaxID=762633 RepID=F6DF40_THETG|nr:GGDEF domain-containing protein [Thermus thermophilus]AEG34169.1 diguanylate cyclase [Thermus thermophilus SG0.5JP17-16]
MAFYGLLALLAGLALFPPTAPWSERFLTPLVALGAGAYLFRKAPPWGLGLLFWGLGDLGWTLGEPLGFPGERSAQALLLEFPYLLGYLALTWALLKTPGKPLRLTLLLLPLGLWGLLQALQGALGVDRLYIAWDALLLLLLLPRLEPLFQGRFLGDRALWGVGFLLILFADLAYAHLEAQGGYPVGHPVHLLWTWGYLLLALGVGAEGKEEAPFAHQALALLGLFLLPAILLAEPTPLGVRLFALYGGAVGGLGLLFALYLERRRTEEKNRRWTRFLEALARLSPRVTQTLSPEAVLTEALQAARELLPQAVGLEVRARRGLVGRRAPHFLSLPLNHKEEAWLYLEAPPEEEIPPGFLVLLGERLRQVLKQVEWGTLALTDPLTGLLNRRGLEAELPKLLALSRRYRAPVSAVMLDIDRFKRVNDTYGHPVGDEVLRRLGRILQESVRKEDLAVRYGGEEFLLLYGADRQAAKEVVERIRARFRAEKVEPIPYPLTLSAGVAGGEMPEEREALEAWILQADYALLRAKETGRDRVTLA